MSDSSKEDITKLRSITGSLAWISRQTRPDLGYRVSRLQSSVKDATVSTLADANAVVVLAHKGHDVALCFPAAHLQWSEVGVITVTDALLSPTRRIISRNRAGSTLWEISRRSRMTRQAPTR